MNEPNKKNNAKTLYARRNEQGKLIYQHEPFDPPTAKNTAPEKWNEFLKKSDMKLNEGLDLLLRYKETGLLPEQIREMDGVYLKKCREVAAFRKRSEWVSVEERLPESKGMVLVCDGKGKITLGYCVKETWFCSLAHSWGDGVKHRVFAWMPLPEPYRPEVNKPVKRGRCDVL